jgi:RNA polymerase sigma-70 factor, ECF subfamily
MQVEAGQQGDFRRFEQVVLPHLDAAYNLARWLVRNPQNAEDVVQEACLRAVRFFSGYHGGDPRAWLLRIVRNTAYSFLEKNRPMELVEELNETLHVASRDPGPDAETLLLKSAENSMLQQALEELPVRFREVLILRELEELSYKEIAEVMEIPIGSVMSALARGREQLRRGILRAREKEVQHGVRR